MPAVAPIQIKAWDGFNPDLFKQQMHSQTQATFIALENVPPEIWPTVRDTLFLRLKHATPIQALSLRNIPWTPEDLKALSAILKPSGTRQPPAHLLYDLDLSHHDWTDLRLMEALVTLLSDLPLRGLALGGCVFTTHSIALLSTAVMRLVRLKTLDVSHTALSGESLALLKAHLVSNMTLRVLYLNHCQLQTDEDLTKLVAWIQASQLRGLQIEGNFTDNLPARKKLRKAWQESTTLQTLLCDCPEAIEKDKQAKIKQHLTYRIYAGQLKSCLRAMGIAIILGFVLLGTALSVGTILIGGVVIGLAWGLLNTPKKAPPDHPMPFEAVDTMLTVPSSWVRPVTFIGPSLQRQVTPESMGQGLRYTDNRFS